MPDPKRDMPKAVFAQVGLGTLTAFLYAIAIFYAISDLDAVVTSNGSFPLAEVYAQATGSPGGTFGLLLIILLSILICVLGTFLTVSLFYMLDILPPSFTSNLITLSLSAYQLAHFL